MNRQKLSKAIQEVNWYGVELPAWSPLLLDFYTPASECVRKP